MSSNAILDAVKGNDTNNMRLLVQAMLRLSEGSGNSSREAKRLVKMVEKEVGIPKAEQRSRLTSHMSSRRIPSKNGLPN